MFAPAYGPVPEADHEDVPEAEAEAADAPVFNTRYKSISEPIKQNAALQIIIIISLLLITILLSVALITGSLILNPANAPIHNQTLQSQRQCIQTTPRTTFSCGNSTAEAEELGCKYDPLSRCWLHQSCPHDHAEDFAYANNGKPFPYFYDETLQHKMKSYKEVGDNAEGVFYSSLREHLMHCLFLIRRGHDVHRRGDRLDEMLADMEHVDHCTDFLKEWLQRSDPVLDQIENLGKKVCFLSCT
ncbi:hypothetical protein N7456_010112 [Penicillium angulare]|uniref:Uncharacterized protein n=1 Tax=Penicillium angulare TaxID=116970 RepID=A0A9W9F605_9EURO|nr:hypothetical protein N7456_010112 [Penicillium angulare]